MPNVKACSVSPSTIALGGQANLTVTLDAPAPPGGLTVLVNTDFNGSQDTLLSTPQSLGVFQGQSSSTFLLQTQVVDNPATQIIFLAFIGDPSTGKAAQLNIT